MKKSVLTLSLSLALGLSLSSAQTSFAASETGTRFPAPSTVSAEMAESVAAPAPELWLTKMAMKATPSPYMMKVKLFLS